jgi:predicted secreted hydrolase
VRIGETVKREMGEKPKKGANVEKLKPRAIEAGHQGREFGRVYQGYRAAPSWGRRGNAKWYSFFSVPPIHRFRASSFLPFSVSLWLIVFFISPEFTQQTSWRQALPGYQFRFPRDHASHPEYKIEWWYYTGNVSAQDGRRFGYQITFFRIGVDANPANPSRWAVRDLFMTHLAVTDIDGGTYQFAERINRAGVGWAGANWEDYRVWNEDWEARLEDSGCHKLRAFESGLGIDLELEPGKPPVIHGERGISQKGAQVGNASHYYSLTRMPTRGLLKMEGKEQRVTGLSWMDHEFGTSFLEKGQLGWDWLSLQLEDGNDLMLFQLRRADGSPDPHSSGTLVEPGGRFVRLDSECFRMEAGERWRSPQSGASYPIAWRIRIPAQNLDLTVKAAVANQELRTEKSTGVTYWEGSIIVSGTRQGRQVHGRGYLEMTGYLGPPMSNLFR